jgi:hypothetical protein
MSMTDSDAADALQQCTDDLGEFIATLEGYSTATIAMALRMHLESILRIMIEREECTDEEASEFLQEMTQGLADDEEE